MNKNEYKYYCRLREPMLGCIPTKNLVELNYNSITINSRNYYGYVVYKEKLIDYDDYDLDYFN